LAVVAAAAGAIDERDPSVRPATDLMTRLAIVEPLTLLGTELRARLASRFQDRVDLWSRVSLLTADAQEAGTLTETAGGATVVLSLQRGTEAFTGLDLVFFCGDAAATRPWLDEITEGTRAILLCPDVEPEDARPCIPSLGLGSPHDTRILCSPPAAVLLAHVLHPLRALGLRGATATLMQSASLRGEGALHELFEQTKGLITFASRGAAPILGHQWAFNVTGAAFDDDRRTEAHLRALLGEPLDFSVQTLNAGAFHGMGLSIACEFAADPGVKAIAAALKADPSIETQNDPATLGLLDAAQSEAVLVRKARRDERRPERYWLWAVADSLTRGGAINAVDIAETLFAS
jgi:aspartate-semialdehyde dehydrogenase